MGKIAIWPAGGGGGGGGGELCLLDRGAHSFSLTTVFQVTATWVRGIADIGDLKAGDVLGFRQGDRGYYVVVTRTRSSDNSFWIQKPAGFSNLVINAGVVLYRPLLWGDGASQQVNIGNHKYLRVSVAWDYSTGFNIDSGFTEFVINEDVIYELTRGRTYSQTGASIVLARNLNSKQLVTGAVSYDVENKTIDLSITNAEADAQVMLWDYHIFGYGGTPYSGPVPSDDREVM